jgi:hypothetical protein
VYRTKQQGNNSRACNGWWSCRVAAWSLFWVRSPSKA